MGKHRPLALLAILALAIVAVFATGCGDDDNGDGGGTLTVGSDIPYPPFEQGKAPNYTGFDIELVEEIAKRTDREAQFTDTSFETIFRDLAQGKFEMVASATTITPEREENVDFTDPYYLSEQAILVAEGSPVKSLADLDGKTVGVQQGTTGEEYVEDETGAAEVRPYPEGPDVITPLRGGTIDAAVIDLPVAQEAVASQGGGIEVAEAIPTEEEYGFVVAQGEEELLSEVNEALQEIKDDGTYARIYERWFKQQPPQEVLSATHEPS